MGEHEETLDRAAKLIESGDHPHAVVWSALLEDVLEVAHHFRALALGNQLAAEAAVEAWLTEATKLRCRARDLDSVGSYGDAHGMRRSADAHERCAARLKEVLHGLGPEDMAPDGADGGGHGGCHE